MSRVGSQQRTLLGILAALRPHWRRDANLPARIESLLSGDRRLGSRDRRLYRELVYTALRYLPWVEGFIDPEPEEATRRIAWLAADIPATQPFRGELARGLGACPAGVLEKAALLGADPQALNPGWLRTECPEAFLPPLLDALQSRAPLWIRLQDEDPSAAFAEFERLGWAWRRSPLLAGAVSLPQDADVAKTDAYRSGRVEIQDVGSQLILASVGVEPGGRWLDACAGAGGKALQLASLLGPRGRVVARDVRPAALAELGARAARAGLADRIAAAPGGDPGGGYDGVLVDAPCSGSGTWRRSPHLRWATTERAVRDAASLQLSLLTGNLPRVATGGLLVYATCSLCRTENESVVERFMVDAPGIAVAVAPTRLRPESHDGDGYFLAAFRRT